ncbi:MAG: hypothetical protein HXX20_20360 [Chloroflexi bacterium]|nr:hypothetical protein [Chloroflexota bacterium]
MNIHTAYVEIVRYYDTHAVEGEEVGQNWEHLQAVEYLYKGVATISKRKVKLWQSKKQSISLN